jgi:hypothetical protein
MGTFNPINGATGVAIYQVLAHIPLSRVCQCQRPDLGHASLLQIFGCFCISRKRYEVNPRVRVHGRNHHPSFFHAIISTPFTSPRVSPLPPSSLEVFPRVAPGGSAIHTIAPSPRHEGVAFLHFLTGKWEQTGSNWENSRFGYLTWSALYSLFLEYKLVKHCLALTIS